MGDIFDDVMAMESTTAATTEETAVDTGDANFSASELDDIMAEIDNLEKDFEAEATAPISAPTPAAVTPVTAAPIEIASPEVSEPVMAEQEKVEAVAVSEKPVEIPALEPVESKILTFEKKATPNIADAKSNVSLSASGTMTLNLTFKIGEEDATLVIDQEKGLLVSFSGVEVSLHSEKGCSVEMANGVSFTVPVQNGATASMKKSA